MNYYNELDPKCAAWLRELIKAGLIPDGKVDERSITDVCSRDLHDFTQCHFFAGIGGWPYALKLAGWPTARPVWTGSCPCQPFSCAGKRKGTDDSRHLWPSWFNLIRECRPSICFGEQVASKDALGWLDGVFADLEVQDYACGASDMCAAGVGAPHIRQRLCWLAESAREQMGRTGQSRQCSNDGLEFSESRGAAVGCEQSGVDEPQSTGLPRRQPNVHQTGRGGERLQTTRPGNDGFWSSAIWHGCRDQKARRISPEPALFPLADGLPGRVALLRGAGNAIVPQVAAEFIKAYLEIE